MDPRRIALSLERMLLAMASYHDMASKSGEMFYHGLLLGLTAYMADDYMVESNREYGMGRADITLISRGFDGKRAQKAILFELKQLAPDDERPLEEAVRRRPIPRRWNATRRVSRPNTIRRDAWSWAWASGAKW